VKGLLPLLLLVLVLALAVSLILAQGVGWDVPRSQLGSSVTTSDPDGRFVLRGSLGQAEAGRSARGGDFSVSGGFWAGPLAVESGHRVYLPVLQRPP